MTKVETKFSKIAGTLLQTDTFENKIYGITQSGDVWEW
jgi:hypothetical protein